MDIAKSFFNSRPHDGYSGKGSTNEVETVVSDTEDEIDELFKSQLSDAPQITPTPGGPFSALTPSMWPQDILLKLAESKENSSSDQEQRFDEFGFLVEEDLSEETSKKLLKEALVEDPDHKLQWTEYTCSTELSWDDDTYKIPHSDKLRLMVQRGIPHSLRPHLWMRLSGALEKKHCSDMVYKDVVKASSHDSLISSNQIEKDLLRTMPTNACFCSISSTGIPRLRRVLRAIAWLFPEVGYCQGTNMAVASLLLLLEEEDAFWLMATIVEDLLPASYFSSSMIGIQADQRVLRSLVSNYLSEVDNVLKNHDIELSLISLHWFVTLFASVIHMKVLLRIWDLFFLDGCIVLFQVSLGMLKIKESMLQSLENAADIFNALSDVPGSIYDVEELIRVSFEVASTVNPIMIDTQRRKHLAFIMADQNGADGSIDAISSLPKQRLNRRQFKKSKSVMQLLLFGLETDEEDTKNKNIRQTEILVDLRQSILLVARHFGSLDPKFSKITLVPDYSLDSHAKDHEAFLDVSRNRKRRAKALLDFERNDDDELGFRKNDIITIVSQKDEHCWVGELNSLRGWFPAKFVELLDERSKLYSSAGDDSVSETIMHLIRGNLCPALKQILEHGMKRPSFLGGPCHPWLFIEEAANREVERDFTSVYSRLVLCKTFRLDEDGKVLTPEELLYRSVQCVNLSHDACHAQMDVKLRSLICIGLNEQVLHLWFEILCSSMDMVEKWYYPWSFVSSPGWVQIKCELRILSQFPFSLNPNFEIPAKKEQSQPLKDGVRDMLVKHHLFSWDL
ncbi:small G protein signaling modulator 3 homolog isoform X1 [Bemisia tabaci]|uniref:small G protein signaling modulator 3 homolog isoform X1 n=2 Tax=Bemisia tabaci TaxID=7038 RepID=UPI003B284ADB